jgi:type 1 fimbria pilin
MDEEHHTWGEEPVPLAQFQLDDKTLQIASYEWFDVDNQTLMSAGLAFISLSADGAQISHTKRTFQELSPALSSSISQKVLGATLQPDNKVIIAVQFGEKPVQMALFRFLPDGTPDINFADNGVYLSESDRDFTDYSDFTMLHDQIYLSGERHHQGIVINLTEQNFPPEIIEDSPAAMQLTEDSLSSELIIQASDDNGDGLEWFVSHMPEKGTLTLNPAGEQASVLYQPDTNASGSDNFEVTVQDWRGAQQSHQINVMISPINDVPEISLSGSSTTINPGMAVTITADIHDVDNDQLSLVWSQESGVSIDLNNQQDNSLTFTAPEVTEISQIVVKATVSDGQAEASATMTMTIEPATDNQQAQPSSGGALQYLLLLLLLTSGPRMFKQRGI